MSQFYTIQGGQVSGQILFIVPQITIQVEPVTMLLPPPQPLPLPTPTPTSPSSPTPTSPASPPAGNNEQRNRSVFTCANCGHTDLSWLDMKEEDEDENVLASEMSSISDDCIDFAANSPFKFLENEYEKYYDHENDLANINSIIAYLKNEINEEMD